MIYFIYLLILGVILFKINLLPSFYLGFMGDDFVFLTPKNLNMIFAYRLHTLTYRPLEGFVIVMLYSFQQADLCLIIVNAIHILNVILIGYLTKILTANLWFALMICLLFASSSFYFEATHVPHGINTVTPALFFLLSLIFFMRHIKNGKNLPKFLSYFFYAASIFYHEYALFGFFLFPFLFAYSRYLPAPSRTQNTIEDRKSIQLNSSFLKPSIIYAFISFFYVFLNVINPIRAIKVARAAKAALDWDFEKSIMFTKVIASYYGKLIGVNYFGNYLVPFAPKRWYVLGFLILVFFVFINLSIMGLKSNESKGINEVRLKHLFLLGFVWSFCTTIPIFYELYLPERGFYLSLVGFLLALVSFYFWILNRIPKLSKRIIVAGASLLLTTVTHAHRVINSYQLEMYKQVNVAQNDILNILKGYIDAIPEGSVVGIRCSRFKKTDHHFWYPFNDSWGLGAAIRRLYQRRDLTISTVFTLHEDHVTFWDKSKKYKYDEIIFLDYNGHTLIPLREIKVNETVKTTQLLP